MGYKIIQHTDGTVQIEFSPVSKYSFTPYFLSPRPSTSNTSLNSVYFTPKIHIPIYQQQEFLLVSSTHSDILMFLLSSLLGQKKTTIPFFYWFFKLRKQRKQLITLRNEEGHQLEIKH